MTVRFRRGTPDDSLAVYRIFREAVEDLGRRLNMQVITGGQDPEVLEGLWQARRPMFEHLARTADEFWIAEEGVGPVGYARSTLHDGVRELTELFVLPRRQSSGVGRELLARAFPREVVRRRIVIATIDPRALAGYHRAGLATRFPIFYLTRAPEPLIPPEGLAAERAGGDDATLRALDDLDAAVIGWRRRPDHRWLAAERDRYLFRRGGQIVGYAYVGEASGPFALLNEADIPAALTQAERLAAERGIASFGLDVPGVNQVALSHLLGRGYRMDPFFTFFMSDEPLGSFERYVHTTPSFIV